MKPVSEEIRRLQKVLENNPRSIQFARLAEYLLRSNQLEEAVSICRKGLEHHPTYANGHYVLGLCYYEMGDAEEAEAEFNRALLYDPEHLNARHYQARLMKDKEWYNAYILRLKQLLAIDPFDRDAREQLEAYEKKGEPETLAPEAGIFISEDEEAEVEQEEFEKVERAFSEAETAVTESSEKQEEPPAIEEEDFREEAEPLPAKDSAASAEETDRKDYEYILDDIFRDEIGESDVDLVEEEAPVASEEDRSMTEKIREAAEALEKEEAALEEGVEEQLLETASPEEEKLSDEEAAKAVFEPTEDLLPEKELQEPGETEGPEVSEAEEEAEKPAAVMGGEGSAELGEPEKEERAVAEEETAAAKASQTQPAESPQRKEPIVTSTLGEIYAAQGHYAKAINVYEILLKKDPDNEMYKRKIEELRKKLEEQQSRE